MKKKIAILCELKERELLFLTVLKEKLELVGYSVKIIPSRLLVGLRLLSYKPDLIIINGLRSDNSFIRQIYIPKIKFNSQIISLYSEQVGKFEGLAKTYDNKKILNSVDAHVTWGASFAEGLRNLGVPKEKIWINGSFALDLPYFFRNKQILKKQFAEKFKLDYHKKWILVSDNIINYGNQRPLYKELRYEFSTGIKKIAEHFKDHEIVFRPHPANKKKEIEEIKAFFQLNPNVSIIGSGHNIIWAFLSELMIIWRSTSSIEAWAVEKEVFALQTEVGNFDYWHKKLTKNYKDVDHLIHDIQNYLSGRNDIDQEKVENRKDYMRKWFYKFNGESFDRFAFILNKLPQKGQHVVTSSISQRKIISLYLLEALVFVKKILTGDYKRFIITAEDVKQIKKITQPITPPKKDFQINFGKVGNTLSHDNKSTSN